MQFLFAIGLMLASSFISSLMQPKPQKPKAASLEEFDFPKMEEGAPQAVSFGDTWSQDWAVLWYGNLRSKAIKSKGGKK